jgi:hypothetical protein
MIDRIGVKAFKAETGIATSRAPCGPDRPWHDRPPPALPGPRRKRHRALPGQYIIGTQEYGRFYLKKGMSFGLHKRAFLKAFDAMRQRATWSLS